MQAVPVNLWAILASGVVSMVLGFLWYGPLFGKTWMSLSGINPSKGDDKGMGKRYAISFVGSLVMAYVLLHSLVFASVYTETTGLAAGLMVGLWSWLGFIAPLTLGSVLWEGKSWKLWFLNNAYQLILLLIMGMILATWK